MNSNYKGYNIVSHIYKTLFTKSLSNCSYLIPTPPPPTSIECIKDSQVTVPEEPTPIAIVQPTISPEVDVVMVLSEIESNKLADTSCSGQQNNVIIHRQAAIEDLVFRPRSYSHRHSNNNFIQIQRSLRNSIEAAISQPSSQRFHLIQKAEATTAQKISKHNQIKAMMDKYRGKPDIASYYDRPFQL